MTSPNEGPVRCALYARISKDDRGLEKGVTRQLEDARKLAANRGWKVIGEYVDNDTSAYSGKERKEWRRLLAEVQAGGVDRVVAWQLDRLWRNSSERVADGEVLTQAKVGITLTQGGDYDLSKATDGLTTGVLGELAAFESRLKGERVSRAAQQRAKEGKANTIVAYGWRREREYDRAGRVLNWSDVENPQEAEIVREIVRRILGGETVNAITADLIARGVPSPSRDPAKPWTRSSVRHIAGRPANAGIRTYKGQEYEAAWPALVSRDEHERVVALLASRSNGKGGRPAARKYLLSGGVGECVCGSVLRSKRKRNASGTYELYVCKDRGCVGRNRDKVDEWVGLVVCDRLSRPDAAQAFAPDDTAVRKAQERAEGIRARLNNAADAYAKGRIDLEQLERINEQLRPTLDQLQQEIRHAADTKALEPLLTEHSAQAWRAFDVRRKRLALEALGVRVVIHPQKRTSGPRFDESLVRILWPGQP